MMSRSVRRGSALKLLAACALGASLAVACNPPPFPKILTPPNGTFSTAGSILVTGKIQGTLAQVATLTVNGVPVPKSTNWSATVTLDPGEVFNPIVAEVTRTNGQKVRTRITVIAGESVADGGLSPMGLALRLNDTGLDVIEPTLGSLVDLDLAALLPLGTVLINNQCMVDSIFGCLGRATVSVFTPAPSISSFGVAVDSLVNFVDGDITVNDVDVNVYLSGTGVVPSCPINFAAASTLIDGDYTLQPSSLDPSNVDVNQQGNPVVSFVNFQASYGGVCNWFLIGDIIQAVIGDIQPIVVSGLQNFLQDPDGGGPVDAPVAAAIQTALEDIAIAGPIGEAIGVTLEAPLFDVYEDNAGITLDSDARITALMPDPEAPDLAASLHLPAVFPSFGANTPVGNQPYGLGISISSSAFNQLLKAETESGLLRTSITEIDIGTGPFPLTVGNILFLVPALAPLPVDTELRIDIAPVLAPVVTGQDGPFGEIADLRIGHLLAKLVVAETGETLVSIVVDVEVGLTLDFVDGQLSFNLGTIEAPQIALTILENPILANEAQLIAVLNFLLPSLLPSLADSLGTFPIPSFLGLNMSMVEIAKTGDYMGLYTNLVPAP
jgi:hypothetical protein